MGHTLLPGASGRPHWVRKPRRASLTPPSDTCFTFLLIDFGERKGGREEGLLLTCGRIHWSTGACALTGDGTRSLGALGRGHWDGDTGAGAEGRLRVAAGAGARGHGRPFHFLPPTQC